MPTIPQPASDTFAGFGDTLTSGFGLTYLFGLPSGTEAIRGLWEEAFDLPNTVDPCSKSYKAGKYAAYAWGVAFAGAVASEAGVSAFARGGPNWHIGLELPGKLNLIHLGNSVKYGGLHIGIGYITSQYAWFHIYLNRPWPWFY